MSRRPVSQKTTLFLAMAVGVFCACYCVLSVAERHYWAKNKLDHCKQELQGWEACRVSRPAFYRANAEAVSFCLESLTKAQEDPWADIPKIQLTGFYILAGLGGAIGGFLGTLAVLWLVAKTAYKPICGFLRPRGAQQDAIPQSPTTGSQPHPTGPPRRVTRNRTTMGTPPCCPPASAGRATASPRCRA